MNLCLKTSKSFLMNKKTRGFTLLELVFVLAIIGILLTICLNNFFGVQSFQAERQLHKMENDLRSIRAYSIRNRVKTWMIFSEEGYRVYIGGKELLSEDYVKGLEPVKNEDISLGFSDRGRPALCNTVLFMINGKKERKLVLAPVTGKISLEVVSEEDKGI